MDGPNGHGDVRDLFPGAIEATCDGIDGWVTAIHPERGPLQLRCPRCAGDKVLGALHRLIPPRFQSTITLPRPVEAWIERGEQAQGLYLAGPVGTGKTHVAWMTVRQWCIQTETVARSELREQAFGWSRPNVIFTRMTDLLDDLRPGDDSRQRIRDCQNAALLVIDDLGAEKASEWTQERFYSVIDHRYANCLPLIVTSNLPPNKLSEQTGERAASRLAEMCTVVPMTGTDRRRPAA